MILILENGRQLRGDFIQMAVLRNDATPICATLEAHIKYDANLEKYLQQGKVIEHGEGSKFRIVKSGMSAGRGIQGDRPTSVFSIVAFLDDVAPLAMVRKTAIIKSSTSLAAIYRACGCSISGVENDFAGVQFSCFAGDVPTYQVASLLQEEGGIVRYRRKKIAFLRLTDLKNQDTKITLPANAIDETKTGFLERHQIPSYFSTDKNGQQIFGNRKKERRMVFVPNKDIRQLTNMSRILVRANIQKIDYSGQYCAGDVVNLSNGEKRVVITAAHVFMSGTEGGAAEQYTRLWLGTVEE